MARPTKAARAAITKRLADAIDLRLARVDRLTVARKLAVDLAINGDRIAYPQGYGVDRYAKGREPPADDALVRSTCKDVREALKERRAALDDEVNELRIVEAEHLDQLFFVAYKEAVRGGQLPAIVRALRIMERRARLLGFDRSARTEVTWADGGALLRGSLSPSTSWTRWSPPRRGRFTVSSDRTLHLIARYRSLEGGQRRTLAARATPQPWALLLGAEKHLAMDRSPGTLAAVVTNLKAWQAPHLDLVDQAWIGMAEGHLDRVMLTMPPRHGKSQRAARWGPLSYLRKYQDGRVIIAPTEETCPRSAGGSGLGVPARRRRTYGRPQHRPATARAAQPHRPDRRELPSQCRRFGHVRCHAPAVRLRASTHPRPP
ncbi:hypothetical protein OG897_36365 [Streptomyces sp. NBC_00237]|uniref:hypothetical protein n=1 Tax=Streptomyces sp. NBC_00237 TaxID=2975687 RepID=UPI002258394D|nr:hypothetical protein [Streptomyces sp. NBC_00237]MCX5206862.1 hypothetical protein [Streptomyces sp. NBC_00237]